MIKRSPSIHWLAAALIVFMAACDENGRTVLNDDTGPAPFVGASFAPSALFFETIPTFGCPLFAPFRSNVSVFIDQRGGVDLTLNEVLFRFVDGAGIASRVTFGRNDLNSMFGIPFIASGTRRAFTFDTAFGCGFTSTPHTLAAHLVLVDRSGRRLTHLLNGRFR